MSSRYDGRVLDVADLLSRPPEPMSWNVDQIVAPGAVSVLSGGSGIGKSALAVSFAAAAQSGAGEAAGIAVAEAGALVVDGEQGRRVIQSRLHALVGVPPSLGYIEAGGLDIRRADDRDFLTQQIVDGNRRLIVADSLRRLAPGAAENSSDEMVPVMEGWAKLAQDLDVGVLLLHHRGKADVTGRAPEFRGSEAIRDVADALFILEADPKDPERLTRRRLRCGKMRLDELPQTRWVSIGSGQSGGLAVVAAAAFHPDDLLAADDPRAETRRDILTALRSDSPMRRADLFRVLGRSASDKFARDRLDELEADGSVTQIKVSNGEIVVGLSSVTGGEVVRPETRAHNPANEKG